MSSVLKVRHLPSLASTKNLFVASGDFNAGIRMPLDSIPSCSKVLFGTIDGTWPSGTELLIMGFAARVFGVKVLGVFKVL